MSPSTRFLTLLALTSAASAVSLSQFPPILSSLPIPCQVVYRQDILGCSPSDFNSNGGCSVGCIKALQAFTPEVDAACGNRNINGQNIIVAFLAGAGPQSICPNADDVLGSGASSSASSTTATAASKSSSASSTAQNTDPTTTPQTTATSSLSTSTDTSTSSSASSTPVVPTSTTASQTASHAASTPSSKSGNDDGSGGGSPFDTDGNVKSAASALTCSLSVSLLSASAMLLAGLR